MNPQPKGKKLPKWFWPVGIVAAIVIGLYLRNRSSSSQATNSQQTNTPTDVTSNPYYYTAGGAYPTSPYDYYGSSPYGAASLAGSYGLPSNFDPTSFEEGITYAQQSLGTTVASTPTMDSVGTAPIPTVANNGTPAQITLNISTTQGTRTTGKPSTSGRNNRLSHHKSHQSKKVKK